MENKGLRPKPSAREIKAVIAYASKVLGRSILPDGMTEDYAIKNWLSLSKEYPNRFKAFKYFARDLNNGIHNIPAMEATTFRKYLDSKPGQGKITEYLELIGVRKNSYGIIQKMTVLLAEMKLDPKYTGEFTVVKRGKREFSFYSYQMLEDAYLISRKN